MKNKKFYGQEVRTGNSDVDYALDTLFITLDMLKIDDNLEIVCTVRKTGEDLDEPQKELFYEYLTSSGVIDEHQV